MTSSNYTTRFIRDAGWRWEIRDLGGRLVRAGWTRDRRRSDAEAQAARDIRELVATDEMWADEPTQTWAWAVCQ